MAEEPPAAPLPDDWPPMPLLERLEFEVRCQWAYLDHLRAEVADLRARVAEMERARARDED